MPDDNTYCRLFKMQSILVKQRRELDDVLRQLNIVLQRDAMCRGFQNQQNQIKSLLVENKKLKNIINNS